MNGGFYIAATGLEAQQRALDVIANNIANVNTSAFKRVEVQFSELLGARPDTLDTGATGAVPQESLGGVVMNQSPRVFAQGALQQTGQSTDIALQGEGFIELAGPGGQTYLWRGGHLKVNDDGFLAADNGMALKAMISVPAGASQMVIGADGKVTATVSGQTAVSQLGQIDLTMVKDATGLTAAGSGLYQVSNDSELTTAAPGENGAAVVEQGAVEGSNVQLSDEMVTLLLVQRAYGANAQVVQAGDQLMAIANQLKR
jgi:flagellar basal-body rod protein FlgG